MTKLVVWGGRLVCALQINASTDPQPELLSLCLSKVVKAPDWILDLAPQMSSLEEDDACKHDTCAAVTAHNALLQFTIQYQHSTEFRTR